MPFVSQDQRRYMYAKHPKIAKEFSKATPKGKKLPEHKSTHSSSSPVAAHQLAMMKHNMTSSAPKKSSKKSKS